eukprot:CAMPEP_0175507222 /NCGR_PEP_ID=MMETSP0096-20121207/9749_1 /TAXON_ID=311494 /ORGANISM="Alexandrium monilatum, Strain CCMP3105" /LENGTH=270 /DNA_ID=CAMNT_0016809335 /DNA_START=97 /DNA_END=908 /DNA_ORIENTATION=-
MRRLTPTIAGRPRGRRWQSSSARAPWPAAAAASRAAGTGRALRDPEQAAAAVELVRLVPQGLAVALGTAEDDAGLRRHVVAAAAAPCPVLPPRVDPQALGAEHRGGTLQPGEDRGPVEVEGQRARAALAVGGVHGERQRGPQDAVRRPHDVLLGGRLLDQDEVGLQGRQSGQEHRIEGSPASEKYLGPQISYRSTGLCGSWVSGRRQETSYFRVPEAASRSRGGPAASGSAGTSAHCSCVRRRSSSRAMCTKFSASCPACRISSHRPCNL